MARKKKYNEEEVIEKAMYLFWKKGYEATSMRMLEHEMGINQFSIYASFGSKQGVFVESIKMYNRNMRQITKVLQTEDKGLRQIKKFFYELLSFTQSNEIKKGCMVTNTINEMGLDADDKIMNEVVRFTDNLKGLLIENLQADDPEKDDATLKEEANYLLIAIQGFSMASKVYSKETLDSYINNTFKNISKNLILN